MAERTAVHAHVQRLLGGEVACLSFGLSIESVMIYVRHLWDFIS
jgi:hypothetical protein